MTFRQLHWVPDWARRAVFYHIYPLGFLGAPRSNDRASAPTPRLAELRRWYDHLSALGVTAIYFGPLFESLSHGYDTTDYFSIDRRLGTNDLFREIVRELHARDLHVIVDGVFNHVGRDFFAFQDVRAHKGDSRYRNWFYIDWSGNSHYGDGFAYADWEGHQSLVKLNLTNPETRQYIFEVVCHWMGGDESGVDGWRLDVACEVGPDFWWEFRRVCKEAHPDCFLLGEVFRDDYRKWVAPDLLDSGTNYQLHKAILSSLNDANFWELKSVLERERHAEWGVYRDLMLLNFVGNHDVTRIRSALANPAHVYPALIFLLTAPGIPCLYYGDEVGLSGHKRDGDAALRTPMPDPDAPWPDDERALFETTRRLIAIRKSHSALIYGDWQPLETGSTTFSFLRCDERQLAVVVLNSGDQPIRLEIPTRRAGLADGITFRDVLDPEHPTYTVQDGQLTIEPVYPCWGRILIA
jgi:cyclomaltodextrinase